MRELASITDKERRLIADAWLPHVPGVDMGMTLMQFMMNAMAESSAPLASYVLNRVAEWLDGASRFHGDGLFGAIWTETEDTRVCTLSRKADDATWVVTWGPHEYLRGAVALTISGIGASGERQDIAIGEITTSAPGSGNRHGFDNAPTPVLGTVEGHACIGAFDDLCDFATAVRASIPDKLLEVEKQDAVTFAHVSRLEALDKILEADGGLPGRLCAVRQMLVVGGVNRIAGEWRRPQYPGLIDGLRSRGAVWGNGILSYNDSDYYCCLIDFSDGSIGLFSDNVATCADQHAYVARLEMSAGIVNSVAVYVFRETDNDYQGKIDAIGAGLADPDFVYDYVRQVPSFPGNRYGWYGMNMFLWQSLTDSIYGLESDRLEGGSRYWSKDSADAPTAISP
jgi:hypothetical protein